MLREKRNVSRLSRIIMEDHNRTIMPRSRPLPTTLQLSLMLTRPRRMKMDTYSKLMKRETRPGASISQVAGPVSTTQVNHLSKRLNCSQMVPWWIEIRTRLRYLQGVASSPCILRALACPDKASNHTKSRLINSITIWVMRKWKSTQVRLRSEMLFNIRAIAIMLDKIRAPKVWYLNTPTKIPMFNHSRSWTNQQRTPTLMAVKTLKSHLTRGLSCTYLAHYLVYQLRIHGVTALRPCGFTWKISWVTNLSSMHIATS